MTKEMEQVAKKVCDEHWKYVRTTLAMHGINPDIINVCEHHYTTAWVHAWKHCLEHIKGEIHGDNNNGQS